MTGRATILDVASRNLYWLILVVSVVVLYRGHDLPGGGFIGGLIAVCATVLWAVTHGSGAARNRLPTGSPVSLATFGILLAGASGIPALFYGLPFLTHLWGAIPLGFTKFKVSTVMVFDLGVFLTVWGAFAGYALALLAIDEHGGGSRS